MAALWSFEDVCDETDADDRALLLGNGFSIACTQTFAYTKLMKEADFGGPLRARRIRRIFEQADTSDFETVLRQLEEAAAVARLYPKSKRLTLRMRADASKVKDGLAGAIAQVHPPRIGDVGDNRLDQVNAFLQEFGSIFTLNYDALLHWARMREPGPFDDGFRRRDDRVIHIAPDQQRVFWLHGALHLREDGWFGGLPATIKATWDEDGPLIDYVNDAIQQSRMPLVVTEGTWKQKVRTIRQSPYLSWCHSQLSSWSGGLITFGWGMNSSDKHITSAIVDSGVTHLYAGVRPGASEDEIADVRAEAAGLRERSRKRIAIRVWDTGTVNVW